MFLVLVLVSCFLFLALFLINKYKLERVNVLLHSLQFTFRGARAPSPDFEKTKNKTKQNKTKQKKTKEEEKICEK